ncbi:MAG: 6-hydroxymethylpterin diphosphokinase MptE-like protein [Pirellulaceae bacterium]|nr:6-hydroxymethylpterin diphosphokinase MptE-like protein [Pirellulaceae bacterium]
MKTINKSTEGVSAYATQHPTMNPYRAGIGMILDRLRWDLTVEAFRSRRKMRAWKNRYDGKKAVIVCNGPSLLQSDLSLLEGTFAFGLNKINLLFDRNPFRPDVIVAVNQLVIEQNANFFNATELPLFINCRGRTQIKSRDNIAFLHTSQQVKMARDCSMSINEGCTVTAATLQIAFHIGFTDVALIGCDHNFASKGPANATVTSGAKDESHFDPRYFSGGQKWQLPDLVASEFFYSMAGDIYRAYGRRIINCTVGGQLELFPRMELKDWVGEPAPVPT